jgi:hypothetical protein
VRRFTVDEYHRMIAAGILTEQDRVELLDGWITPKMPRNPPHDSFLAQAAEALRARLPQGWHLRNQSAVTLATSEPEPDLAVVLGPASRYRASHRVPADVALLVEVADSSLSHDRTEKGRLYAAAAIPAYWIVNLVDGRVEVYTDPTGPAPNPGYRQRHDYGPQDGVPLAIGGQVVGPVPGAELLL